MNKYNQRNNNDNHVVNKAQYIFLPTIIFVKPNSTLEVDSAPLLHLHINCSALAVTVI